MSRRVRWLSPVPAKLSGLADGAPLVFPSSAADTADLGKGGCAGSDLTRFEIGTRYRFVVYAPTNFMQVQVEIALGNAGFALDTLIVQDCWGGKEATPTGQILHKPSNWKDTDPGDTGASSRDYYPWCAEGTFLRQPAAADVASCAVKIGCGAGYTDVQETWEKSTCTPNAKVVPGPGPGASGGSASAASSANNAGAGWWIAAGLGIAAWLAFSPAKWLFYKAPKTGLAPNPLGPRSWYGFSHGLAKSRRLPRPE